MVCLQWRWGRLSTAGWRSWPPWRHDTDRETGQTLKVLNQVLRTTSVPCPQSRVNDFSPSQSTCRQLIEVTSHLIGVCGGMMTPSSSGRFFFGVLSTCSLRERERESHLHSLTAGQSTINTFRSRLYISTFGSRTVGSSSKNSRPSMSLLLR